MKPGWRWGVVAALVAAITLAVSAWNSQRAAHQPEAARPAPPLPRAEQPAPASTEPKPDGMSPRARPGRERADRP